MTTTINASTSAGLVQTADTSGVLALQTAGTTAVSISAAQVVTLTNALAETSGGTGTTTGYYGFKNRIINGAMVIDQRNAGASVSQNNAYGYINDRWWVYQPNVGTAQRISTGNSDFPYALRVQRTVGNTGTTIVTAGQVIETNNCQDLAGQTITVSVYLTAGANFSAASSQVYISVITGTGTDQGSYAGFATATWTGWANTLASATTISTTRTKYSASVTIPAGTNEIGFRVYWYPVGTAGAADYVDITGVQLEKGSTATSFDYRPYGTELQLCQRYYESTAFPDAGFGIGATRIGVCLTTNSFSTGFNFLVPKRTNSPTVTLYSRNGNSGKVSLIATGADVSGTSTVSNLGGTGFWGVSLGAAQTAGAGIETGWTASAEL